MFYGWCFNRTLSIYVPCLTQCMCEINKQIFAKSLRNCFCQCSSQYATKCCPQRNGIAKGKGYQTYIHPHSLNVCVRERKQNLRKRERDSKKEREREIGRSCMANSLKVLYKTMQRLIQFSKSFT